MSGGQSGVDRAALDVALEADLAHGGWCPRGRLAEDGVIPSRYRLKETGSSNHAQRTEWNVRDADATLILVNGTPTGGTAYTIEMARSLAKPYRIVQIEDKGAPREIRRWLDRGGFSALNIAGPRESTSPGIYAAAKALLSAALVGQD
jgi:hypothetical protein